MFESFPQAVGVRNILNFSGRVKHLPALVASHKPSWICEPPSSLSTGFFPALPPGFLSPYPCLILVLKREGGLRMPPARNISQKSSGVFAKSSSNCTCNSCGMGNMTDLLLLYNHTNNRIYRMM
jgi:hypothetical protein